MVAKKMVESKKSPFFLFFLSLLLCFLFADSCCKFPARDGVADTHGMFVFGSSLVDNGNNNFIEGSARANYLPYGIDFPHGPSGRFSNGRNVIDTLGELLKLPTHIPPFMDPMTKGDKIVHGVDFASGGSGILNDTGSLLGVRVMNLDQQIKSFEEKTMPKSEDQLCRCHGTKSQLSPILSNYLFVLGVGGNDFLFNYFLPTSKYKFMDLQTYAAHLTSALSTKIKKLYSLGGRKFVLISIYPLGCIPAMIKASASLGLKHEDRCIEVLNRAAIIYNSRLKALVDEMKPQMPGSNLVYVDSYKITKDIIHDPNPQGFKDTTNTCCEVPSMLEGGNGFFCKKGGGSCGDRNSYLFFDGLHPTEAMNVLLATKAFSSNLTSEAYPFNVKYLATSC